MKSLIRLLLHLVMIVCLVGCLEQRALAYVDPGSGLLACQTVSAVLLGIAFSVRRALKRLVSPRTSNAVDVPQG